MSKSNGLLNPRACRAKYEAALTAFVQPGNREYTATKGMLTVWAGRAGMSEADVLADVHALGITTHDGVIKSGFASAIKKGIVQVDGRSIRTKISPRVHRRAAPLPCPCETSHVRTLIAAGLDMDTPDKLRTLSPVPLLASGEKWARHMTAEMMFVRLFAPTDVVRLRQTKDDHYRSKPGANMMPVADWLKGRVHPADHAEIVRVNPLTGREGKTTDGKPSFDAETCVADFRHMVFEFDDMPLADQCRFWAGFVRRNSKLTRYLVCLVLSGGKSIHGVIRANAPDAETWKSHKAQIGRLFRSDPEHHPGADGRDIYPYRLDVQALMPLTGCRLAGAIRKDTRKVQELLYLCREWHDRAAWEYATPPCRMPKAMCGVCQNVSRCPYAPPETSIGRTA